MTSIHRCMYPDIYIYESMQVCICVCVCEGMHACMYACCTCMHACMQVGMYACMFKYMSPTPWSAGPP